MKSRLIPALCLALAISTSAFAQDSQSSSNVPADDQATPADSQSTGAAGQQAGSDTSQRPRHRPARRYNPAAMALTGDDAKTAAYQNSDRVKSYPPVDHGHVPGDPPVIDHSSDQAPVPNPTSATITVPPTH
ncbi:MAG TPA: hypothetical protein VK753_11315 [Xanthomonadaceae bacterium]|nr:hypothetical protein [Xanthomonadaceae bacterium]